MLPWKCFSPRNQIGAIWSQKKTFWQDFWMYLHVFFAQPMWVSLKRDFTFTWNQRNPWEMGPLANYPPPYDICVYRTVSLHFCNHLNDVIRWSQDTPAQEMAVSPSIQPHWQRAPVDSDAYMHTKLAFGTFRFNHHMHTKLAFGTFRLNHHMHILGPSALTITCTYWDLLP